MKYLKLKEGMLYDGSQIEPQWAFRKLGIKDSSIVSWIGPMEIKQDNLIDYEDHGLEIKGDQLLHFIIEHFDCQPANMTLCYHRQRLLVMMVKDLLEEMGIKTLRDGDDLYYKESEPKTRQKEGKLSVSIATCSNSSMKIHFGLNVVSTGTPSDVEVAGLFDCLEGMGRESVLQLEDKVCQAYINEISSIQNDITKTKVF